MCSHFGCTLNVKIDMALWINIMCTYSAIEWCFSNWNTKRIRLVCFLLTNAGKLNINSILDFISSVNRHISEKDIQRSKKDVDNANARCLLNPQGGREVDKDTKELAWKQRAGNSRRSDTIGYKINFHTRMPFRPFQHIVQCATYWTWINNHAMYEIREDPWTTVCGLK